MKFDKFKHSKVTSVKCNQPPGGSSKFSLGYDNNYYDNLTKKNENKNNIGILYNVSILNDLKIQPQIKKVNLDEKERSISSNQIVKQTNEKNVTNPSKNSKIVDYKNVYKPSSDKVINKTSVKVSNAPGGKSNISLGFNNNSLKK